MRDLNMASTKPYLVRAIYEWCVDHGYTPHLAVLVDEHVVVPAGYVQDGQIVLNVGPDATSKLVMGNDTISFEARFGGVAHALLIPVGNVLAVYARETGQGMAFEVEPRSAPVSAGPSDDDAAAREPAPDASRSGESDGGPPPPSRGSHLKVIK
jgi:stringent starvation protein B